MSPHMVELNESQFPRLAKLAQRYLQIPATSATSERLFSKFGIIYDRKRMSLLKKTAEAILFPNFNKC